MVKAQRRVVVRVAISQDGTYASLRSEYLRLKGSLIFDGERDANPRLSHSTGAASTPGRAR